MCQQTTVGEKRVRRNSLQLDQLSQTAQSKSNKRGFPTCTQHSRKVEGHPRGYDAHNKLADLKERQPSSESNTVGGALYTQQSQRWESHLLAIHLLKTINNFRGTIFTEQYPSDSIC